MRLHLGRNIAIVHATALLVSLPRLIVIIILFAVGVSSTAQDRSGVMQEEILKEKAYRNGQSRSAAEYDTDEAVQDEVNARGKDRQRNMVVGAHKECGG